MIAIINTGAVEKGEHVYRLQINDELVAIFTHDRSDGLDVCLGKAAIAAKNSRINQLAEFLSAFTELGN